ncbi:MAG: dephospho-CoA kinase [Deltaproteobacteria bacterium]|nr:MAG: dephospho-CoA kinase [Deltaproteobacteria bacterium]
MAAPIVGLTGGIGAGKSTVAAILTELGARVIDADRIGHEVYRPGSEGFARVVEAFGPGVVGADGAIDRRTLGARVFADPAARARLGALVHPLIAAEVGRRIAAARAEGFDGPLVVEAAVLLEAGWRPLVDRVWVVSTRREHAIARIVAARGLTREEVERRLDAQLSDAERRRQADLVIENDGPPAALQAAVEDAWRTLVS